MQEMQNKKIADELLVKTMMEKTKNAVSEFNNFLKAHELAIGDPDLDAVGWLLYQLETYIEMDKIYLAVKIQDAYLQEHIRHILIPISDCLDEKKRIAAISERVERINELEDAIAMNNFHISSKVLH
jgi:hypothetical protein